MDMVIIFFRVLIVYLVVLIYLRVMGKRQLGEMQPFELVITLLIADIASLPMTQVSMPILFSLVPLTTLVIVEIIVSLLSRKSIVLRKVLNGTPMIVVNQSGVQYEALKQLNMSIDDLMEGLRGCGYFVVEDVLYAIVETNGSITAIPKKQQSPVVADDLKLNLEESSLPIIVISSGKIVNSNLAIIKRDKTFLKDILQKAGEIKQENVLLLTIDTKGKVHLQTFDNQISNVQIDFKGDW